MEISLHNANDLGRNDWRKLQGVERDSLLTVSPEVDPALIDELIMWDKAEGYFQRKVDPKAGVGAHGMRPGQEFGPNPQVVIAEDSGQVVGFAWLVDNVSGRFKGAKRLTRVNNYKRLEVPVVGEYRDSGILERLALKGLSASTRRLQRVAVYAMGSEEQMYKEWGLIQTGEAYRCVGDRSVRQVRMQRSARQVVRNLEQLQLAS